MRLYLVFLILFSSLTFSQTENIQKAPGLIESLQTIVKDTRTKLRSQYQKLQSSQKVELNPTLEMVQESEIDSLFLKSIFLHSEKRYLEMINLNSCHLYALLENQLLRSALGTIEFLMMVRKGQKYLIRYDQFVDQVYKYKCQGFAQYSKIFSRSSLKKTVMSIPYPVPKTEAECDSIIKDWKKNNYLPYLCKIPHALEQGKSAKLAKEGRKNLSLAQKQLINQLISDANYYSTQIPYFERSYLTNLCDAIEEKSLFCSPYLAQDAWAKIINGEIPEDNLIFRCNSLLNKPADHKLSDAQKMVCATKLKDEPEICTTKSTTNYSAIFPRPNCSQVSMALNYGRLKTNFHDCPGQIDNGSITNLHRIIGHFEERSVSSAVESCKSEATFTYYDFLNTAKRNDSWPLKACYFDKIENKEICKAYIPGSLQKSPLSEDKIIASILQRMGLINSRATCSIITEKEYRPVLLEYKNGCFITFNQNNCSNSYCPKKIIINQKEIDGITFKGKLEFDYFPNNWSDQKKSVSTTLEEIYKIPSKKLQNLTMVQIFFKQHPKGIIHGLGCAEDLLPNVIKRKSFNQCTPAPFIVDGMFEKDENKTLVLRTAFDDILSPRLTPWNWVFTSVMKYQQMHPLKQWNLYGLTLSEQAKYRKLPNTFYDESNDTNSNNANPGANDSNQDINSIYVPIDSKPGPSQF
ncbi:MAG: hypothetical protein CME60_07895 [Halobacteriovoraceae bacterium]|nr:hypothetical protein [Halobacteriovoraceae bacterium]